MAENKDDNIKKEKTVSIFGYGSLMSIDSAIKTMPSLSNFRLAKLIGYKRIFSLFAVDRLIKGYTSVNDIENAGLAIRPNKEEENINNTVFGCVFDILEDELPSYFEREKIYKVKKVPVITCDFENVTAYTVIEQTDEEYINTLGKTEYDFQVGKYYSGSIWQRKDILPAKKYFEMVCTAAINTRNIELLKNFLDETYLSDEITTIREYLFSNENKYYDLICKIIKIENVC